MRIKLLIVLALLVIAVSGGCASKSKAIRVGAVNFSTESQKSITLTDKLMTREITETLTGKDHISDLFKKNVLNANGVISTEQLEKWANPYGYNMPELTKQRNAYIAMLLTTYAEFGNIFSSLDKGSLFAKDSVNEAIPITKKLTANMAALSKHWCTYPANFIHDKGTLAKDLNIIISNTSFTTEVKTLKISEVERKLHEIQEQEKQMTLAVVEQALKSAQAGQALIKLLEQYNKLTVDDINELLAKSFELAGLFPGLSFEKYQSKTTEIITELEKDPQTKEFINLAFASLSSAK